MSQPKRWSHGLTGMSRNRSGPWVTWDDYAALAAENANLKALQWETLKERNKAEAENERLRKAGDAMAKHFEYLSKWNQNADGSPLIHPSLKKWNAAKEGSDAK